MRTNMYQVLNEANEDCFGRSDEYETALSIARAAAHEGQVGDIVLITHRGFVIRHLTLMPDGIVFEEEIR